MKNISYKEFAPAKINLALHIIGRLENKMHQIDSLVAFANIGDELTAKFATQDRLEITGEFAKKLNANNDNLILKALEIFREQFPSALPQGVDFELKKNLPLASGIGGGSSDAGATLRLLARLSKQKINKQELEQIAQNLGADVPACLLAKPCLMQGFGEKLTQIAFLPKTYIVLINPLISISTKDVFLGLEQKHNKPIIPIKKPFTNVTQLANWLKATRNDLLQPALNIAPIIKQITNSLSATNGCQIARMSGSGATIFALYEEQQLAKNATLEMQNKYPNFWIKHGHIID